jgi:hypothetical protein
MAHIFDLDQGATTEFAVTDGFLDYWTTNASSTGTINQSLTIPCVPGVQISFSATDGRPNPNDWTGKLWSNTVTCSCPA